LAVVADATRSGKPWHYDASHEQRIITVLDAPLPRLRPCREQSTYAC